MGEKPTGVEVLKYLGGVNYPISRDELLLAAQRNGAPDDVLERLRSTSAGSFSNPTEVSTAVSGGD